MKITSFHARDVHGYLPINVSFNEDLTFLTGLNGTGKTTGLRLMMALLTPNIDELGAINFTHAEVNLIENERHISISAFRQPEGVSVKISTDPTTLYIPSSELQMLIDSKRRDEGRSLILERYLSTPVVKKIRALSTPMFLGLDRRFNAPSLNVSDEYAEYRRSEYLSKRYWQESSGSKASAVGALVEVNFLVVNRLQEIRAQQEKLDDNLRTQFFSKAFEYKPSELMGGKPAAMPSREEVIRYRQQLTKIEQAAESIKIPMPAIQAALAHFFERMSKVVDSMEQSREEHRTKKQQRKSNERFVPDNSHIEWIINKPQADRIVEHLALLETYIEQRKALRSSVDRFLGLVNSFFAQTNKQVTVSPSGQLGVTLATNPEPRSIEALSSGERQLLVMLAHLSLNETLVDSGVFIVDEPELSLHIDWQERFVDAVVTANPKVQLILATHSPAIILDRDDACRVLGGLSNA